MLAGFANVELIYTHTVCKLAAPAVSEYFSVKIWLATDPELGVAETALTVTGTTVIVNAMDETPNEALPE